MARFGVEPGDANEQLLLDSIEEIRGDGERLLDALKRPRLDSKLGGLWCDLGFWGGLLPSNKVNERVGVRWESICADTRGSRLT